MTPEAELLRGYAENILAQETKVKELLHETGGTSLCIGATKTIGEYVIAAQAVNYLHTKGNTLSIDVDNTEKLLSKVSDGKLDFALIEGFFDRKQYASRLYREEPFVGICAHDHPFAGRRIDFDELWGEHLLLREEGSGTRNILEQILQEHSHSTDEFHQITTIANFGLMRHILKMVNGITFGYRALLSEDQDLSEFSIHGCDTVREFNYVFLDNPFARNAVDYFDSFRSDTSKSKI